ncbi:MAG: head morphogenesis protein [Gammaproteobacteria bacterium]|nr:head morphogenesis protein [Gammaproteobacteria bacterium]
MRAADIDVIEQGLEAARYVLHSCCGLRHLSKAVDLSTKSGFNRAVVSMASELRRLSSESEADAVRAAVGALNVDWLNTTAEQRARLVNDALVASNRALSVIPQRIQGTVGERAREVVEAGREDARKAGLTIGVDFNAVDNRIVDFLTNSNALYVTDEYGRRTAAFEGKARQIITDGVGQGLGREEIAGQLNSAAAGAISGRSEFYWEVLAGAFVTRGRSLAQMSSYAEAGIDRYKLEAVQDEATTNFCRSIDGTEFSVSSGIASFNRIASMGSAEQIKQTSPWVRETPRDDGSVEMWVRGSDGEKVIVGVVSSSAVGEADTVPPIESMKSPRELNSLGIGLPPFHGLCRTTTVPVL